MEDESLSVDHRLGQHARAMRCNPTEPEKRLWRHLSGAQLGGLKFRRQAVIGSVIADFLVPPKALIVEVDGDTHDRAADRGRDKALDQAGYRTLRFSNGEVMSNIEGVLEVILTTAMNLPDRWSRPAGLLHPNPSSEEERLSC